MTNDLKVRLQRGESVFGFWSMIPSPMVAHVLASSGADFVIADLEHGPLTLESVERFSHAVVAGGANPICRMPRSSPEEILRVLDLGIPSLMMSHVTGKSVAQDFTNACLYPPLGTRGLSPYTALHGYDGLDLDRSMSRTNDDLLLGVLVEGPAAIEQLPDIASLANVDLVYIGLFDLASSLGHPGNPDNPNVRSALQDAVSAIKGAGKVAGTVARDQRSMQSLTDMGVQFIAYRNDTSLLMQACRQAIAQYPG